MALFDFDNIDNVIKYRAFNEPLYLLEIKHEGIENDTLHENSDTGNLQTTNVNLIIFTLKGSTGNVYDITVKKNQTNVNANSINTGSVWKCSCPHNQQQKKICKHIYFVIYKVLKQKISFDDIVKFYKDRENNQNNLTFIYAEKTLLEKYQKLKNCNKLYVEENNINNINNTKAEIKPRDYENITTLECAICFDLLQLTGLFTCSKCLNSVHENCWNIWKKTNKSCVYCRYELKNSYSKDLQFPKNSQYINLFNV